MMFALNIVQFICQLYLSEAEKKKKKEMDQESDSKSQYLSQDNLISALTC